MISLILLLILPSIIIIIIDIITIVDIVIVIISIRNGTPQLVESPSPRGVSEEGDPTQKSPRIHV